MHPASRERLLLLLLLLLLLWLLLASFELLIGAELDRGNHSNGMLAPCLPFPPPLYASRVMVLVVTAVMLVVVTSSRRSARG